MSSPGFLKVLVAVVFVLITGSTFASAAVQGDDSLVTTCSGKDDKGNQITVSIHQDQSVKEYSSSNPSSITVDVVTANAPLHYMVYDSDSSTDDASMKGKSDDNGGMSFHIEGAGVSTTGKIGFLQSSFKFVDCQAGPAAPIAN